MNPNVVWEIVALALTVAKTQASGKVQQDATLAASLLGGYLADRLGRRKTIVLSMFSGALVMLCLSQAHSLPVIVLLSAALLVLTVVHIIMSLYY